MSMSLCFVAICLLLPQASSLTLLTCVYGLSQCLTLNNDDGLDKAKELGCATTEGGEFFGGTVSTFEGAFDLTDLTLEGSTAGPYLDGMPCTFSPDTEWDEAIKLKLSDIEINMADGTTRNPVGATYVPAVERNELLTLLTVGNFGFSENLTITSVTIKGSTYSGAGTSYTNQGHELTFAKWWDVDSHNELEGSGIFFQDGLRGKTNCGHDFSETTHLIQVVFSGGMTVTFDSNRNHLAFDLDQIKHKQMFKVILADGSELAADKYLGLADEADGDNYVDICMKLTDADVKKFAEGTAKIRLISTRSCSFLVLPKGDCLSDLVGADCGDSATESQEICITEIPDAATKCDPKLASGRFKPYTPTAAELDALTDCEFITPEKVNNFIRNLVIMMVVGVLIVCGLCGTGCYCYFSSVTPQMPEEEGGAEGAVQLQANQ